jgi:hypothetical protein
MKNAPEPDSFGNNFSWLVTGGYARDVIGRNMAPIAVMGRIFDPGVANLLTAGVRQAFASG